jgi:hypothetical protein
MSYEAVDLRREVDAGQREIVTLGFVDHELPSGMHDRSHLNYKWSNPADRDPVGGERQGKKVGTYELHGHSPCGSECVLQSPGPEHSPVVSGNR